jgi:hypothetical protein
MRKDRRASQREIEFMDGIVSPISCGDGEDDEDEDEEDEEEEPKKEEEEEEEEPISTAPE